MKSQILDLEEQLKKESEARAAAQSEKLVQTRLQQVEARTGECATSKTQYFYLEGQLEDKNAEEVDKLQKPQQDCQEDYKNLLVERSNLVQRLKSQKMDLEEQLRKESEARAVAQSEIAMLEQTRAQQVEAFNRQCESWKKQHSFLIGQLEEKNAEPFKHRECLSKEVGELRKQFQKYQEEHKHLLVERSNLVQRIQDLKSQNIDLEEQLQKKAEARVAAQSETSMLEQMKSQKIDLEEQLKKEAEARVAAQSETAMLEQTRVEQVEACTRQIESLKINYSYLIGQFEKKTAERHGESGSQEVDELRTQHKKDQEEHQNLIAERSNLWRRIQELETDKANFVAPEDLSLQQDMAEENRRLRWENAQLKADRAAMLKERHLFLCAYLNHSSKYVE